MTISTLAFSLLSQWAPNHWFSAPSTSRCITSTRRPFAASSKVANTINSIASTATVACARAPKPAQTRPLRIVRLVEQGQPRAHVGRMVISGRMADVCAELDRLAAAEAP